MRVICGVLFLGSSNLDLEVRMMQVKEIMTADPACCTSETGLQEVAQMMIDHDCGEVPVVENKQRLKPVGVITDRDIVCRTIAKGLNPLEMKVADCMSKPCITVTPDMSLEECCKILEENQIRRVPVVDADGSCCGIVALADIALHAKKSATAEVVKEVSEPSDAASAAGR
jgi:CBS domain-containing protein